MSNKFTLILAGQTSIVLTHSAGQLFAPAQLGFTSEGDTNLRGISLVGATPVQPLDLVFDAALTERLDETHLMTGFYGLRPGVLAQLWVRMDVWEAHLRRLGRLPPETP